MSTATRPDLTDRQRRMLDFIRAHIAEHGYGPSVRDIRAAMGVASLNGVMCHVRALVKKGYMTRAWNTSRSFRVVDDGPGEPLAVLRLLAGMAWPLPSAPTDDASHAIYLSDDELATLRRAAGLGDTR